MNYKLFLAITFCVIFLTNTNAQYKKAGKFIKKFKHEVHLSKLKAGSTSFPIYQFENFVVKIKKSYDTIPELYMSNFEVSISEYKAYLSSLLKNKQDSLWMKKYPDTLVFLKVYTWFYNEPMSQVYFWHPKYSNYPIVGVSKNDAQDYLLWLKNNLTQKSINKFGYNVIKDVRLPMVKEWCRAVNYPKSKSEIENEISPTHLKSQYKKVNTGAIISKYNATVYDYGKDGFLATNPVNQLEKNALGLYNLLGNVSEICSDTVKFFKDNFVYSKYQQERLPDSVMLTNQIILDSLIKLEEDGDLFAIAYNSHLLKKPKKSLQYYIDNTMATDVSLIHCYLVGASWKDDIKYLNPFEIRILQKDDRKSYLGFRYVIDFYTDEELKFKKDK